MVESLCAFDGIMITKVTIIILTISYGVMITLTISLIGTTYERLAAEVFMLNLLRRMARQEHIGLSRLTT